MKRITLLVATIISIIFTSLIFISTNSSAEEKSITFKMEMKPNKTYTSHTKSTSFSEMDFIGDQKIIERIKSNHLELPMIMENTNDMTTKIITKEYDKNNEIPATLSFEDITYTVIINGQETPIDSQITGMKILGRYDSDSKFKVDSIIGGNVSPQVENSLKSMFESTQQAITFPEKPMKVGETFHSKMPMAIPMEGMNPFEINIDMEYKLIRINEDTAFFDINATVELNTKQEQMNMTAKGTGTGTAEFDIKESYLTKYKFIMPMDMTMQVDTNLMMKMKMHSISEQIVVIK